ncbi:arsenate reductase/protein-tyrosine-phosphatase family protein [Modestobacter sp. SYSU DS0657]
MRILFVCTGNICRSPLAERLATVWAEQSLGRNAAGIAIRSAGFEGLDGKPMDKRSGRALIDLGGDPTGFTARTLVAPMADRADLVLTMTRRHRRLVLAGAPRALRRTFTLPEAADLLHQVDVTGIAELPLAERARELAVRLNSGRAHRRTDEADDVEDPIGQSSTVHADVAGHIAATLRPLADVLFAQSWATARWAPTGELLAQS